MKFSIPALLMILVLEGAAWSDVVQTIDGRRLNGLVSFANGTVVVSGKADPVNLRLDEIARLTRIDEAVPKPDEGKLTGLMAEFIAVPDPSRPMTISRVSPGAIDWGAFAPSPFSQPFYTFRFTGSLIAPVTGNYRIRGGGYTRIVIDGRTLGADPAVDDRGWQLIAGKPVPVVFEGGRKEDFHYRAGVGWSINGRPETPIPMQCFVLPADFVEKQVKSFENILPTAYGGLKGEYFSDETMRDRKLARLDPVVNFLWGKPTLIDPALTDRVSIRWTGRIQSPKDGPVRFAVTNTGRMWIDGKLLIDAWTDRPNAPRDGTVPMKKGQFYDLKLETTSGNGYGHFGFQNSFIFDWMPPVDQKYLYPAEDMPRAQVILPLKGASLDGTYGIRARVALFAGRGQNVTKLEVVDETGKAVLAQADKAPWDMTIMPTSAGPFILRARVTNSAGITSMSEPVKVTVDSAAASAMTSGWSIAHVGASQPPTLSVQNKRVTLTGGMGSFGDRDSTALPMATQLLRGDGEITAKLASIQAKEGVVAMGGITLRQDLSNSAAYAALLGAATRGGSFVDRPEMGQGGSFVDQPLPLPVYLRMIRSGSRVATSWSKDGSHWTESGSTLIGDDADAVVGLIATSLNAEEPATATFEDVNIRTADYPVVVDGPGVQLTDGTFLRGAVTIDGDKFILTGFDNRPRTITRGNAARLFYEATSPGVLDQVPNGWRGAIVGTDMIEGELTDVTANTATVTSIIFGIRSLDTSNHLAAVVFNDVSIDPRATIVRCANGYIVATAIGVGADTLTATNSILGTTTIHLSDLQSLRREKTVESAK